MERGRENVYACAKERESVYGEKDMVKRKVKEVEMRKRERERECEGEKR